MVRSVAEPEREPGCLRQVTETTRARDGKVMGMSTYLGKDLRYDRSCWRFRFPIQYMYLPPRLVRSGEERSQEGTGRQVSGMGGEARAM